ncbi:hypothetical protein pdul_cds_738 [Pandoravirus dulcis]|uniref:Uncharacterized protein n=1 Tax=Pandoravirus dulcis TaxID=1349409 RepID=S4VRJ8_9VIRU|nr:hypothetical protein pdul_cds_738 [Pandoravirus dulcis]AGO82912.1 hypothetical protein pdul_cds_738 [Pandoravirus dulcis]
MASTTMAGPAVIQPQPHVERDLFARAMADSAVWPPVPAWDPVAMRRRCALYALCAAWHASTRSNAPSWRTSTLDRLDQWAASLVEPVVVCPGSVARPATVSSAHVASSTVPNARRGAAQTCTVDADGPRCLTSDAGARAAINERLLHALVLAAVETGCAVDVAAVCPRVGVDLFAAWPTAQIVGVAGPYGPLVVDLAVVL